jgi:hypothetical protein
MRASSDHYTPLRSLCILSAVILLPRSVGRSASALWPGLPLTLWEHPYSSAQPEMGEEL